MGFGGGGGSPAPPPPVQAIKHAPPKMADAVDARNRAAAIAMTRVIPEQATLGASNTLGGKQRLGTFNGGLGKGMNRQ